MRCTGALLVTAALSLLFSFAFARECELGRRVREYEIEVFKHLNVTGNATLARLGCVVWNASEWSYEVCPGRWIRQYREEVGVIVEEQILGVQDRWSLMDELGSQLLHYKSGHVTLPDRLKAAGTPIDAATAPYTCPKDGTSHHTKQVDVLYADGSMCASGFRHSASLHLLCDEDAHTPSVQLTVPFMCNSDVTIVSTAVCDAMYGRIAAYAGISDADMKFSL